MGHEAVKADLVDHLTTDLPAWVAVVAVDGWPAAPERIAAADILPVDEDKPWPVILVSTTTMTPKDQPTALGGDTHIGVYEVKITVAVRTSKSKDDADAAVGRDRLVQAVRWLLLTSPQAGTNTTVMPSTWSETVDPVAIDPKARMVALGTVTVSVRHIETVPDLASHGVADSADVVLSVTTADGTLYTDAEYDDDTVYDATGGYDTGTEYPPKS